MPVTNEGFFLGFPTKNGIFLVVTVTGWGVVSICMYLQEQKYQTRLHSKEPVSTKSANHILQEPNVMATNLSPLHNCSIEIAWYNSTGEGIRQSSRCLPMRQTRTAFNTLKLLIYYHHYDIIPPPLPHNDHRHRHRHCPPPPPHHHHHHHPYDASQDHFPTTPYLVVSCKFI